MGWVVRSYSEDDDELRRELVLDEILPGDIGRCGSLYLGSSGNWHTYLDWDEPE